VVTTQTVPLIALAPLLVVLLGFSILPKLILVSLICFFPITVNTVDGLASVDPDMVKLMRSLGAGRWDMFRLVEWPSALPRLFSGAKVAATYSVIGALVGEWAGSYEGLGHVIIQAEGELDTELLFAAFGLLTIMGIGLFTLVACAERLLLPWYRSESRTSASIEGGH
jgi:putative hydroxymethylpyrimidine transport system permease protein